jgi:hypothetical protein
MALQVDKPMTVTQLGQFDLGSNLGIYTLSLVRAEDGRVMAHVDLDMSQTRADANGFKYARLRQPITLDVVSKPIVIYPGGLISTETYDVRASLSGLTLHTKGAALMADGIRFDQIAAGELIFLNLPHYPGSGTDHRAPSSPTSVTKRIGTNLGVQGVEVSWTPSNDDNWLSYYEVRKNGRLIEKVAIGTFFFDHSKSARNDLDATFEVIAVDGDGNRSSAVAAEKSAGDLQIYEALGDFSPSQSTNQWMYEEAVEDGSYKDLMWDKGGYEGQWAGSGLGRIGRVWMQPSAQYDLSRTFVVPSSGVITTSGVIRKDPSAENGYSCFVRILQNAHQVWPSEGWAEVAQKYDSVTHYAITNLHVGAGDKIRFVVKHNGANRPDPIVWDPAVTLSDSEKIQLPSVSAP